MAKKLSILFAIVFIFSLALPEAQPASANPDAVLNFTVLHTNDLHGRLEPDLGNRGGTAYLAGKINEIRAEVGAANTVLVDAGDVFLAAPAISQLLEGSSTIDIFNMMGYQAVTIGNHEFGKGRDVLIERINQSSFPWLAANMVMEGTEWQHPTWVQPYTLITVGAAPNQLVLGILGVAGEETPVVVLPGSTDGLVFKDMTETILHYRDEILGVADALIVVAHMGVKDSGGYDGLETIARKLNEAGKPVDIMISGHYHDDMLEPVWAGQTAIVSAYYNGRKLGRLDLAYDTVTRDLSLVRWESITINTNLTPDANIAARVQYYADLVAPIINESIGYTNLSLIRLYNAESNLGTFVAQTMRWKADLLDDGTRNNSIDIAFTHPGGLRSDIRIPYQAALPYELNWGATFTVLPSEYSLYIMELTGAQVEELANQSASLYRGLLQSTGISYHWENMGDSWLVEDIQVNGEPLDHGRTYRVVTNNFLAFGGDNFTAFLNGANRIDTKFDMQQALNEYVQNLPDNTIDLEDILLGNVQTNAYWVFAPVIFYQAAAP